MHLKYAKMLAIVVHENMKLGDNAPNNERLSLVNTKFFVAFILLPYDISIILKLKGHKKGRLISRKIICYFVKVGHNVYQTANKSASFNTNQILFSSNRLELSPWSFTHVFQKIETTMR